MSSTESRPVRLRLWIALLAAMCVLSGFAGGLLVARRLELRPAERPVFADYEELLVRTFELEPERERALRVILERYHSELLALQARQVAELQPELARLGLNYRDWIRDRVLPPERRADFDRLAAGMPIHQPGP